MMKKIVLISKDAMCKDYLPPYGNKYFKTPNISALAEQGTVYHNYYTAAPSTVMAYYSMFTGKYAHETEIETYRPANKMYEGKTLFDKAAELGYKCHIIWDKFWNAVTKHTYVYGKDTMIHSMDSLRQGVGAHYIHEGFLQPNDELADQTIRALEQEVAVILNNDENIFLWIHFPHVINGRVAYGSDIELFDKCVGVIRKYVDDDNIFITSDHGNMNGRKGKVCYGFDVYNSSICIPLITPRKHKMTGCYDNTTSLDLFNIIFGGEIPQREFIYSDSAYYVQLNRKLAIIYRNYKYIYNKKTKKEELYDLEFDSNENLSIMEDFIYDPDRHIKVPIRELYYYPGWVDIEEIRTKFRNERIRIWRNGTPWQRFMNNSKNILRVIYVNSPLSKTRINVK